MFLEDPYVLLSQPNLTVAVTKQWTGTHHPTHPITIIVAKPHHSQAASLGC